jgi:transposase-like protein
MMTEQQKSKATALKSTVAATAATAAGMPKEAREDAVALARDVSKAGGTAHEVALALGVHPTTLSRWKRESTGRGGSAGHAGRAKTSPFREVRVEPAPRSSGSSTAAPRALRVAHAPSGLVIDGLDVEALAALLRSLT